VRVVRTGITGSISTPSHRWLPARSELRTRIRTSRDVWGDGLTDHGESNGETVDVGLARNAEAPFEDRFTLRQHSPRRKPMTDSIDKGAVVAHLNKILEMELAGVVRYTHYALMIYGYNRIPIVSWMQAQADESLGHAREAGELITHLGEHPSLSIGPLLETQKHDIGDILRESLEHERAALAVYKELLAAVDGKSVLLEEYARRLIAAEEMHQGDVDKMLRRPGDVGTYSA
jgi:bacterioferritin